MPLRFIEKDRERWRARNGTGREGPGGTPRCFAPKFRLCRVTKGGRYLLQPIGRKAAVPPRACRVHSNSRVRLLSR